MSSPDNDGESIEYSSTNPFFTSLLPSTQSSTLRPEQPWDFLSLVSQLSLCWRSANLIDFTRFNFNGHENNERRLGRGNVFVVSQQTLRRSLPSTDRYGRFENISQPIATKVSGQMFESNGRGLPGAQSNLRSLISEIRILTHLRRHPNVIDLLGVGWHIDQFGEKPTAQPRIVLDFADFTLAHFTKTSTVPTETKLKLLCQLASALEAVHECGIVHGDVKSDNVLVQRQPPPRGSTIPPTYTAKLADFSHSIVLRQRISFQYLGTQGFRAPELDLHVPVTDPFPLDVYAFGMTMWYTVFDKSESGDKNACYTHDFSDRIHALVDQIYKPQISSIETSLLSFVLSLALNGDPTERDLTRIRCRLEHHLDGRNDLRPDRDSFEPFVDGGNPDLRIDYQIFGRANGIVQDQILSALDGRTRSLNKIIRHQAYLELGICHLSSFGDPRSTTIEQGLQYIYESASNGNEAAKSCLHHLIEATGDLVNLSEQTGMDISNLNFWTLEGAKAGHTIPIHRLSSQVRREYSQDRIAKQFESILRRIRDGQCLPQTVRNWELIHTQDSFNDHNSYHVVTQIPGFMAWTDEKGNNALMTAAQHGSFQATMALLQAGANVNHRNSTGETILHFLWNFEDDEAQQVFGHCQNLGADPGVESSEEAYGIDIDPFPLLPGLAVERNAGRGRTKIVQFLLESHPGAITIDQAYVKRMVIWAARLSFPENLEIILNFLMVFEGLSGREEVARLVFESTIFMLDGEVHNIMTAVAQGWLADDGRGWARPEHFWRLCCHGREWERRLKSMIECVWRMSSRPLCCFGPSLRWAMRHGRVDFVRVFLNIYLSEHDPNDPTDTQHDTEHDCKKWADPNNSLSGFEYPEHIRNSFRLQESSSGLPLPADILDSVLFGSDGTLIQQTIMRGDRCMFWTLTQDLGGTAMRPWSFSGSVRRCRKPLESTEEHLYGQNFELSALSQQEEDLIQQLVGSIDFKDKERIAKLFGHDRHRQTAWKKAYLKRCASGFLYLNCYALLACFSFDTWFAKAFNEVLDIRPDHLGSSKEREVWYGSTKRWWPGKADFFFITEHLPPLFHAIVHGNYHLAQFMLEQGASLDEIVCRKHTVLSRVLHETSIRRDTLRFLFHHDSILNDRIDNQSVFRLVDMRRFAGGRSAIEHLEHAFFQPIGEGLPGRRISRVRRLFVIKDWGNLAGAAFPFMFPFGRASLWLLRRTTLALFLVLWIDMMPIGIRKSCRRAKESLRTLSEYWTFLLKESFFDNIQLSTHSRLTLPWKPLQRSSLLSAHLAQFDLLHFDFMMGINTPLLFAGRSIPGPSDGPPMSSLVSSSEPFEHLLWDEEHKAWSKLAMDQRAQQQLADIRIHYLTLLEAQMAPNSFVPTLAEFLFGNDLDWLKWDRKYRSTLRNLGYRHSVMFYAETHILLLITFLVAIINIPLWFRIFYEDCLLQMDCIPYVSRGAIIRRGTLWPHEWILIMFWFSMLLQWKIPMHLFESSVGFINLLMTTGTACFDGVVYDRERFLLYTLIMKPYGLRHTGYSPTVIFQCLINASGLNHVVKVYRATSDRIHTFVSELRGRRIHLPETDAHDELFLLRNEPDPTAAADMERQRQPEPETDTDPRIAQSQRAFLRRAKRVLAVLAQAPLTLVSWPIRLGDWANAREWERQRSRRRRRRRREEVHVDVGMDAWEARVMRDRRWEDGV